MPLDFKLVHDHRSGRLMPARFNAGSWSECELDAALKVVDGMSVEDLEKLVKNSAFGFRDSHWIRAHLTIMF